METIISTNYYRSPRLIKSGEAEFVNCDLTTRIIHSLSPGVEFKVEAMPVESKIFKRFVVTYEVAKYTDGVKGYEERTVTGDSNPHSFTIGTEGADIHILRVDAEYEDLIVQQKGTATNKVMSQKATTDVANHLENVAETAVDLANENADRISEVEAKLSRMPEAEAAVPNGKGKGNVVGAGNLYTDVTFQIGNDQGLYVMTDRTTAEKKTSLQGIPYSSAKITDGYIGYNVSMETYRSALRNQHSILYEGLLASVDDSNVIHWDRYANALKPNGKDLSAQKLINNNCVLPYGSVCSAFGPKLTGYGPYETTYSSGRSPAFIDATEVIYDQSSDLTLSKQVRAASTRTEKESIAFSRRDPTVDDVQIGDLHYEIVDATGGGHEFIVYNIHRRADGLVDVIYIIEAGYPVVATTNAAHQKLNYDRTSWLNLMVSAHDGATYKLLRVKKINDYDIDRKMLVADQRSEDLRPTRLELNKGNKSCYRHGQGLLTSNPEGSEECNLPIEKILYNWIYKAKDPTSPPTIILTKPDGTKKNINRWDDQTAGNVNWNLTDDCDQLGKYHIELSGRSTTDYSDFMTYDTGEVGLTGHQVTFADGKFTSLLHGTFFGWSTGLEPYYVALCSDLGVIVKTIPINWKEDANNYCIPLASGGYQFSVKAEGIDNLFSNKDDGKTYHMGAGTCLKVYFKTDYGIVASLPVRYQ